MIGIIDRIASKLVDTDNIQLLSIDLYYAQDARTLKVTVDAASPCGKR